MIKVNRKSSRGIFSAGTRDVNVQTEGVILCAVKSCCAMAGNDFVAEDIVSCNLSLMLRSWLRCSKDSKIK